MTRRSLLLMLPAVLLLLCSCDSYRAQKAVALAESLAETSPDSAYNILMQVSESDLNDEGRAVYSLVFNQVKYKLYRPASANALTRSVDYFRQHQDLERLQRAYYYRAAINEDEKGSMEQSLVDYKAAESMITPTTDLQTVEKPDAEETENGALDETLL